ncbi:MraY family glycosyltransferase [Thermodesulfitimonas autotrophica]|uniref:MraY family glycosyltransferase n=1 Tax=Thermodesulfitimonas autotrophica TaxID=1894989 RepID=UPI002FE3ED31
MYYSLFVPVTAAAVTGLTVPVAVRVAQRIGAIDEPGGRKIHSRPIPRLGGLAVYLGFLAGFLLLALIEGLPSRYLGLLVGGTLIFLLGVVDDVRGLSPRLKLAGQILAALAVLPFGIGIAFVTHPLHKGLLLHLGFWGAPLTVFWIVAVTNAVNLVDGLDGLAAGIGAIGALTLASVAALAGDKIAVLPALVLAASLLAFLPFNFHPARIFLGDCGAMFIGFILSCGAIIGVAKTATAVTLITPAVILGIPLLDTLFAILRRYKNGRHIFRPDREHLHHRLLAIGLSHRGAVLVVYTVSAILGLSAILLTRLTLVQAAILLLAVATAFVILATRCGIVGYRWRVRQFPALKEKAGERSVGF